MAPAITEIRKSGRKKGSAHKEAEPDKESHNSEVEMQIQSEMERSEREKLTQNAVSGLEEDELGEEEEAEEMEDSVDKGKETMNENSAFIFNIPRPRTAPRKGTSKVPRTPTKISGDPKFLKRSINDLSFTPEPLERKNPRTSQMDENLILGQILAKLDSLSQTVETQTKHIRALEKQVEELTTQAKGNTQANKASRAATKKIETMAERVAAMAATSTPSNNQASQRLEIQNNALPIPGPQASNQKRTSPHLVVDLTEGGPSLNERPVKDIRMHIQASIKSTDSTKSVKIQAMSKDNRQDHRYFLFVATQVEENLLRIHTDEWLLKALPKARIQATTFYPVRVDSVNASAVLDSSTGRILAKAATGISEENDGLAIGRIGWLSQPGKKYGSMVLYLKDKSQVNTLLAKGFLDVGGESATTQVWEERGKVEQRCFNCQKYGHIARTCKEMTVCGNCAETGHHHQDCMIAIPKCANCGGSHRAKDHGHPPKEVLPSAQKGKQPESQRPIIMKSSFPTQAVNPFHGSDINNSAHRPKIGIFLGEHSDAPPLNDEW